MKKLLTLLTIACLLFVGCNTSNNIQTGETLIKGSIDLDLKGVASSDYLAYFGHSEQVAKSTHTKLMINLADYLQLAYCYSNEPLESTTQAIVPYYEQLLTNFEYTISNIEENEKGIITGTITYSPFALGDTLDKIAFDFYDKAPDQGILDDQSFGQLQDANLIPLLYEGIKQFAQNPTYKPQTTANFTIDLTQEFWTLNQDYNDFLYTVIDLNL